MGACCPRPGGLVWSHWAPTPAGRCHCPPQSGYLDSSKAAAPVTVIASAAAVPTAPREKRLKRMSITRWSAGGGGGAPSPTLGGRVTCVYRVETSAQDTSEI